MLTAEENKRTKVLLLGTEVTIGDRLLLRGHQVSGSKEEYWVEYLLAEINSDGKAIRLTASRDISFWQSVETVSESYDYIEILPKKKCE